MTGSQIAVDSACRDYEYYIDPTSTQTIELGTEQYPYRTFKAVVSEILNHFSNVHVEVTIYAKDFYSQDHKMFFVNMTNVVITTHPEYVSWNRRAVMTLTEFEQADISKKARLHLLNFADIPVATVVASGDFTDTEKGVAAGQGNG